MNPFHVIGGFVGLVVGTFIDADKYCTATNIATTKCAQAVSGHGYWAVGGAAIGAIGAVGLEQVIRFFE